ncbi:MAG: AAA family ATPase, partial [Anaerolineae bacterium]|nr:AAA family ATPase [Anaerolineae bacterium]
MFTTEPIICPLLIGREPQVEAIERYLDHVQTGRSQTLLLCGEAGLGKSRLVAETRLKATHQGWLAVEGRCFETNQTLPYAPIIDLLHANVFTETAEQRLQRGQQLPPELFTLLPSLPGQGIEPPPYEAEPDKYRLFFAVAELLAGLIQADAASPVCPLLLIIEDLHWCDENSLELLLYLIRRLASRPVLFLFTYRGDEIDSTLAQFLNQLDRQRLAAEIFLSPLTHDQIDMMVQAIFNQPRPTRADFLQRLHTFTEGNPFFIEELLKSMVMAGDIYYAEDGIWDRKPLFDLQIPRSVQDAVQHRSRQLTPETRSVLTLAAVVGRRFDFTLLQQLTKTTEDDLLDHIKALLTAQFIIEESADQFAFRHALTREAIYTSLLGRERRQLHRTIAQALETMDDDTPTRVPLTDLADHFYRGEVWAKVLPYAQRAGERALTFYAPQSAAIYFSQAIEANEKLQQPPSAQLYYQRGQAYATLNKFEDGLADYQRSLDAARAQSDHRLEWQLLLALGDLWATRDYEKAGDYLHQALECV